MNTVARAWQAALTALEEARVLHERRGDAETVRDLPRHAREMIDVIEAELAEGRAKALDPDCRPYGDSRAARTPRWGHRGARAVALSK
jgi:hypothetical protein